MSGYHRQGEPYIVDMKRSGIKKEDWKKIMTGSVAPKDWRKTRKIIPAKYAAVSSAIRPPWIFEWNVNTPEAISSWGYKFGHQLVTAADGYWPEGIPPDGKSHFIRGDLILMRITVEDHLERRRGEIKRGSIGKEIVTEQFQKQLRQVGASVNDEELEKALGY